MILKTDKLADELGAQDARTDPLVIAPQPNLDSLRASGAGAIDLRLGTWFASFRKARMPCLDVGASGAEPRLTKMHYVRFGADYFLHPRTFVLGVTLEWLRFPANRAGYVVGRSSWGRRGLVIATAIGVHPGFTGCLTLELTNLGEIPIALRPGMRICQLFLHEVSTEEQQKDASQHVGRRKPSLGEMVQDEFAAKLAHG